MANKKKEEVKKVEETTKPVEKKVIEHGVKTREHFYMPKSK